MANVITVTALNRYVKTLLERDSVLTDVALRGEISNFTNHYKTGHFYFSLKDEQCSVKAVMFRRDAQNLAFMPQNGMRVIVRCRISLFERDGAFQVYVNEMFPDGIGAAQLAFEQLKAKLEQEGLFAAEHKKPLPAYPKCIGIVTSKTGAALQDIRNVISRRWPAAKLLLCPVSVQGFEAAQQVADAIGRLDRSGKVDEIIVARGGGSREDLWVFNAEVIARAAYRCKVPLISAIGHEIDFTILDFVADRRAPTPSAAAELAVPDRAELLRVLLQLEQRCQSTLQSRFAAALGRLERAGQQLSRDMTRRTLTAGQTKLEAYQKELEDAARSGIQKRTNQLRHAAALADSLSPYRVLGRGYAMVYDSKNRLCSADALSTGDRITLRGAAHTAECTVLSVEELNESTQKL